MSEVREDAVEKAARLGLTLVQPNPDQVFVDIDSERERVEFLARWLMFLELYPDATYTETRSQNNNWHIYITIPSLSPIGDHERIALQAALGSDPLREMLAIMHGRAGYKYTSVFFEKPNGSVLASANNP